MSLFASVKNAVTNFFAEPPAPPPEPKNPLDRFPLGVPDLDFLRFMVARADSNSQMRRWDRELYYAIEAEGEHLKQHGVRSLGGGIYSFPAQTFTEDLVKFKKMNPHAIISFTEDPNGAAVPEGEKRIIVSVSNPARSGSGEFFGLFD